MVYFSMQMMSTRREGNQDFIASFFKVNMLISLLSHGQILRIVLMSNNLQKNGEKNEFLKLVCVPPLNQKKVCE